MKTQKITFLIILISLFTIEETRSQYFKDFETNKVSSLEDISQIYQIMSQFTYAFCKIEYKTEYYELHKRNLKRQFKMLGVFDSSNVKYSKKILFERILIEYEKNYEDSLPKYTIISETPFDYQISQVFFEYLDNYKFDKLDNQCLLNFRFVDESGQNVLVDINGLDYEEVLLLVRGKLRQIISYAPEQYFWKFPDQNLCRAIYIICRNMFIDYVWNRKEP